jgi:hypothetical protein
MEAWEVEWRHLQSRNRSRSAQIPLELQDQPFSEWFPAAIALDKDNGAEVSTDVQALTSPPSTAAKSYRSMYAYGNHI